jgi:hypothetical protein
MERVLHSISPTKFSTKYHLESKTARSRGRMGCKLQSSKIDIK